jgi:hypothetical protein
LLILKQLRNLSDESVVQQWAENVYTQFFSGQVHFVPRLPCVPTELVEFRKRIGSQGVELIFKESIKVNGKDADDDTLSAVTTVQKKRKGHSRRAAIEPVIGHLKSDYRLARNYLKGIMGDEINILMAAAAMNFKRVMNLWLTEAIFGWKLILKIILNVSKKNIAQTLNPTF